MPDPTDFYGFPHGKPPVRTRRWQGFALSLMVVIGVLLALCARPQAHDIYSGLTAPMSGGGTDCCRSRDCRPVPWRDVGGIIEYDLGGGRWVRGTSVNELAPIDGNAHACWVETEGAAPQPRCLIPPGVGA